MSAHRRIILVALWLVLALSSACAPTAVEPGLGPASTPEIFVFPGPTEKILISSEDIPQPNCDGSAEKADTVERSHTVTRTLDMGASITVDESGQAGVPGVGQVGVGVAVAGYYQVGYGSQDTVTRSTTVKANAGTNILHTIRQYEIWETGEVLITAGSVNQRLPYRFRKDFSMETLPPANQGCPGQSAPPAQPTTQSDSPAVVQPTAEPPPQAALPTATASIPSSNCQETGGESLSPPPAAPPAGCVLIVEWWVPPNSNDCEVLITFNPPALPAGAAGVWWYTYPSRPETHIQAYQAKYPHCRVVDLR